MILGQTMSRRTHCPKTINNKLVFGYSRWQLFWSHILEIIQVIELVMEFVIELVIELDIELVRELIEIIHTAFRKYMICIWHPFECDMGLDGTLASHIRRVRYGLSECHLAREWMPYAFSRTKYPYI